MKPLSETYWKTVERMADSRQYERFCAEGRMLFLSPYPAVLNRTPTKKELYQRCYEMGDLAVAGLSEIEKQSTTSTTENGK